MEKYWGNLRKLRYKKQLTWVNTKEKIFLIGKSIFVILLFDYFFYRALWAFFPLSFLGYLYYQMERKSLTKKKKAMAKEQFKELMFLVSTGQRAGYSAENAFLSGYQEMKNMYGENSSICQMLSVLKNGGENHIPLTRIWKKIGESAGIQEIQEFAEVYEISYTSSGNMSAVMERTAGIIVQKLETEKEQIDQNIKLQMQDASYAVAEDYRISWVQANQNRIDAKRLKEEQPEIYNQYIKEVTSRRFNVKYSPAA